MAPEGLAARCQLLADLGVAMLEQPLPVQDDAALKNLSNDNDSVPMKAASYPARWRLGRLSGPRDGEYQTR